MLFVFWLLLFSCKKDKPNDIKSTLPIGDTSNVLIVCEGSLGNGNATLSVFQPKTDSVFNNVTFTANGQALGDVLQSVSKINNDYFLSINNSDQVVVFDSHSWQQKASINISKPRYIVSVSGQKAYVGSLFSNKIFVLNTRTYLIENEIKMPYQNIEGMLLHDNVLYACCWDTACRQLYKIDIKSNQIFDSIQLPYSAPQSILLDKENQIWIMAGNAYKGKEASLQKLDIQSQQVVKTFVFNKGVEAIKPTFNAAKDSLYFLEVNYNGGPKDNGVFKMSIYSTTLPTSPFVQCQLYQYFWALGIHPISNEIYVGDPKGFVQNSTVSIYSNAGIQKKSFLVGIGVNSFYFD